MSLIGAQGLGGGIAVLLVEPMMQVGTIVMFKIALAIGGPALHQRIFIHENIAEPACSRPPATQDHLRHRQRPPHEPEPPANIEGIGIFSRDNLSNASLQCAGQPLVRIELHRPRRGNGKLAQGEIPLVSKPLELSLHDVDPVTERNVHRLVAAIAVDQKHLMGKALQVLKHGRHVVCFIQADHHDGDRNRSAFP